jgi:hypothetical protein
MERVKGIEPSYSAWEADVLPLNYTRVMEYACGHRRTNHKPLYSKPARSEDKGLMV